MFKRLLTSVMQKKTNIYYKYRELVISLIIRYLPTVALNNKLRGYYNEQLLKTMVMQVNIPGLKSAIITNQMIMVRQDNVILAVDLLQRVTVALYNKQYLPLDTMLQKTVSKSSRNWLSTDGQSAVDLGYIMGTFIPELRKFAQAMLDMRTDLILDSDYLQDMVTEYLGVISNWR